MVNLRKALAAKRSRPLAVVLISCLFGIATWLIAPPAWALTQIKLFDLSHKDCPADIAQGTVTSGGASRPANCFIISGKAENSSGKPVFDADIFGRIYDVNNNNVLPNRTRLGNIEQLPPGISDFEFRISVPANLEPPLKLEQFKAAGFAGKVRL